MAEGITLVIAGVGWFLNIGSYYLGKRSERQQQKRELVLQFYPDLIENLQHSVSATNDEFGQGHFDQFESDFEVLLEMETNGTLKIIKSLDEELYDDLRTILDEIHPSLKKIRGNRHKSWETLSEKWHNWILETDEDIPKIDPKRFVSQAKSSLIWDLWRGNYLDAEKSFDKIFDNETPLDQNTPARREEMYKAVLRIAEEEWASIRSEFDSANERLTELVEKKIIPRMEQTLYNLGK